MKYIKTFSAILTLTILINPLVHAQIIVPGSSELLDKLRLNKGIKGVETMMYSEISGDPFIFKDFREAVLVMGNGEEYNTYIRFDILANEMHIKNNDEIFAIISPEKIQMIETDSIKFIYSWISKSANVNLTKDASYFIIGTKGNCMLLFRKNIRIQDPEPPKLYQDAKAAKFIHKKDTYYLKLGNNNAVLIRHKKDIVKVLNDKKEAIILYMNSNSTDVKKVEDLLDMVKYYNSL